MSIPRRFSRTAALLSLGTLLITGCGDQSGSGDSGPVAEQAAPASQGDGATRTAGLPTAAISNGTDSGQPGQALPKQGSPEWLLMEIKKLRAQPFPQTASVETLGNVRRERNQQIIQHATETITLVHDDEKREHLFNEAVHHLMEARLQLALAGERDDIDALYEDASSLQERDPGSVAAAEAAFIRARFAHTNARRFARQEPRWLEEFSRQARLFATDFPEDEHRAVPLLFSAATSCELHDLTSEAVACYTLIQEKFPNSPPARQVAGILRRISLPGKPLQLAGPTIDGGYVNIDDYKGQPVLVVFWSSDNKRFQQQADELLAALEKHKADGLKVIGVNLDKDESGVDEFLARTSLQWPQIFFADPEKRRWDNDIVRYYGVREIPAYWLVDQQGLVVSTRITPADLTAKVESLLSGQPAPTATAGE